MPDTRLEKYAKLLVEYSTQVKQDEVVMIDANSEAAPLILELYKQVLQKGAIPIPRISVPGSSYVYYKHADDKQLKHFPSAAMHEMKLVNAWIGIGSSANLKELTNIDSRKITLRQKVTRTILNERLKKKWVICLWPTNALAQESEMSLQEFTDFVYGACLFNWNALDRKLDKLKKVLHSGQELRVEGEDTEVTLSYKGRIWVKDSGHHNMPGGEIFTAPLEKSVKGHIKFTFPAIQAKEILEAEFKFKNGKVVEARASKNQDYLRALLKADKGSSYLGEVGIGANYNIPKFIKNILFDEKLGGTVHMAIGSAYKECRGKNKSVVHLDFIKDLRKNGKLYVDGELIQKNGRFLI